MAFLSEQALELVDNICTFLERPSDILSFALSSKRNLAVAIPNHIELRHLRCDIRRISIWRKLADLPEIAERIVSLEIINEGSLRVLLPIIPTRTGLMADRDTTDDLLHGRYIANETEEQYLAKCTQALANAIRAMSSLTRFHWINTATNAPDDLFGSLKMCHALDDVDIMLSILGAKVDLPTYRLWELSNLRKFSINFCDFHDYSVVSDYSARALDMLNRCPNLQDLYIRPHWRRCFHMEELFARGRWPQLKRLTLGELDFGPHREYLEFVKAHPTLEHLSIHADRRAQAPQRWIEHLSNLKGLNVDPSHRGHLSPATVRRLRYLAPVMIYDSDQGAQEIELLKQIPTLRSLFIYCRSPSRNLLVSVSEAIPHVEALYFYNPSEGYTREEIENNTGGFTYRLQFISSLRHLTHLSNLYCFSKEVNEVEYSELYGMIAEKVANASPTMRYLQIDSHRVTHGKQPWIKLERSESGKYTGWRYVARSTTIDHPDQGSFYRGGPGREALVKLGQA